VRVKRFDLVNEFFVFINKLQKFENLATGSNLLNKISRKLTFISLSIAVFQDKIKLLLTKLPAMRRTALKKSSSSFDYKDPRFNLILAVLAKSRFADFDKAALPSLVVFQLVSLED